MGGVHRNQGVVGPAGPVATVSWLLAERRASLEGSGLSPPQGGLGGKALTTLSRASGLLGTAVGKDGAGGALGEVWKPHTRVFRRESAALLTVIIVDWSDLGGPMRTQTLSSWVSSPADGVHCRHSGTGTP